MKAKRIFSLRFIQIVILLGISWKLVNFAFRFVSIQSECGVQSSARLKPTEGAGVPTEMRFLVVKEVVVVVVVVTHMQMLLIDFNEELVGWKSILKYHAHFFFFARMKGVTKLSAWFFFFTRAHTPS